MSWEVDQHSTNENGLARRCWNRSGGLQMQFGPSLQIASYGRNAGTPNANFTGRIWKKVSRLDEGGRT